MTRQLSLGLTLSLAVALAAGVAIAQSGSANRSAGAMSEKHLVFADASGVAIKGYDAVAYHTAGRPTRGAAQFSTEWRGATWRFASAENRDRFKQSPEKFAPAYGGYCAYGVAAANDLFDTDPNAWRVVEGTLYLNLDADIQQKWLEDIPGFIRTGDANWPGLVRARGK